MSLDHEALMKTSNDHHRRLSSLSSLDDPLVSFFEGSASPKDLGIQHSPSNTKRARARSVANGAISLTATVLEENGRLQLELQRLRTPSSSSSPSTNPTFKRHVAEIQRLREELSVTETQLQVTAMQLEEATLMSSNENQNNNELSRLRQTLSVTEMQLENSTTQQQKQSRLHTQEVATLTERLQAVEQHAIEATQEAAQEAATASAKAVAAATTPSPSIEFFERQLKKMKNKLIQTTNVLAKKTLDLDSALYTIENESIRIENIEQNNHNREEKRVTSIMLKTKTLIKKMKQNHGKEMSELKKHHEQLIHQHVLKETQQGKTTKLAIKQAVSIAVKATTSALREKQQHKFETLANELAKTSAFAGNLSEINDQLREQLMR